VSSVPIFGCPGPGLCLESATHFSHRCALAASEMDDYRELQRQRWLAQQQHAQAASSASAAASSSDPVAAAPAQAAAAATAAAPAAAARPTDAAPVENEAPGSPARRIHILPVGGDPATEGGRLNMLAPELKALRSRKEHIKTGLFMRPQGHEFIVVKVEPENSILAPETDYFVEGAPIQRLGKAQFIGLWDFESRGSREDGSALFTDYVSPYFKSLAIPGEDKGTIITMGEVLRIFDLDFQVLESDPQAEVGILDANTMVFVDWDITPEFEKIHIVPFQDTLPHAYEFDVFRDYLKPYLSRNKHSRFKANDHFTFQGVQFKVVCCEPEGPARIGRNTTIYCEGVLHPSLRNLLPPELLEQLSSLPPGLQMMLLSTEAFAGGYEERLIEVQEMLSRRRGLNNETIDRVEKFKWGEAGTGTGGETEQDQCMVCLCNFEHGEEVRKLPCGHTFHAGCIDEWLRRCSDCPICKANVDRAVRQY